MAHEDEASAAHALSISDQEHATEASSDGRVSRRDLGQLVATTMGVVALDSLVPQRWLSPVVHVGFLPAHAQMSGGGHVIDIRKLPKGDGLDQGTAGTGEAGTGEAGTGEAGTGEAGTGAAGTGEAGTGATGSTGSASQPDSDGDPGTGQSICRPPASGSVQLSITNVTDTSASIHWSGRSGRSFRVELESAAGSISQDVIGAAASFTGLEPCTTYSVSVFQTDCDDVSALAGSFTTHMDSQRYPENLRMDNLYCDGMYFQFDAVPCASYYEIQVAETGTGSWSGSSSASWTYGSVIGLCPGKSYAVRVRGVAGDGSKTGWSGSLTFTTPTTGSDCPTDCGPDGPSGGESGSSGSSF